MWTLSKFLPALLAWFFQGGAPAVSIQDLSHSSIVMGEVRHYRLFLPPAYATSQKRYPVIYWFHGWSERYNQSPYRQTGQNYDEGPDFGGDTIARYVAGHDVIVVKWDGWNPRHPGEFYLRPYNVSPVETQRQFPIYFPELMEHIDHTLRTIPDRRHRAVTGFSMGGFMALWVAGKYPDLVGSVSAFMPSTEFFAGPFGFDAEYRHEEMHLNYGGVRVRLVTGSRDFIRFYHRQLNAIWRYTLPSYETENFDSEHGVPGISRTFDFHMKAFADPLPPPATWSHADVYPDFSVWGWEVASNRRSPGITVLENVSKAGFRSAVREWLPRGAVLPDVKLSIASAKLYPPNSAQTVTYIRLRDRVVRQTTQRADGEGRLSFDLDGEVQEIGIGSAPILALAGYELEGADWPQAGAPVRLRLRFWNKGGTRSGTTMLKWVTANANVTFTPAESRLFALKPGESATLPVTVQVSDSGRAVLAAAALAGAERLPFEVPLFPAAPRVTDFQIADGRTLRTWRHAVKPADARFGEGNGDGNAAPGERFAVLFPDGEALRAAELFTADACVDNSMRGSDVWSDYDHVGASAKYSLPLIRPGCPAGHVIHMLARVVVPDKPEHHVRYAAIEFPVWRQPGEEPKK